MAYQYDLLICKACGKKYQPSWSAGHAFRCPQCLAGNGPENPDWVPEGGWPEPNEDDYAAALAAQQVTESTPPRTEEAVAMEILSRQNHVISVTGSRLYIQCDSHEDALAMADWLCTLPVEHKENSDA